MHYINIPGLRNSNENHWQSLWEKAYPEDFTRIHQEKWAEPDCEKWITKMDTELINYDLEKVVLIGHSVGCATIIHWLAKYGRKIKAAFFVAPSDVDRADYPKYIKGFSPMPLSKLSFPSLVVASTNDHVVDLERAKFFAENWDSEFKILENAGHIEDQSGFGKWEEGLELLTKLVPNRS